MPSQETLLQDGRENAKTRSKKENHGLQEHRTHSTRANTKMGDKATVDRKLVVVGDGACGKTCLLIVKAEGTFPKEYVPTVFENHVTYVDLPDVKVELALWDTAGQEDYAHIRPLSYDAAHVFLICCSVDNKDSFDNIKEKWVPEIKSHDAKCPIIIVACKGDMRGEGKALFAAEEGHALAASVGAVAYMECSARTKEGIEEVFLKATEVAHKPPGGGCCVIM